MFTIIDFLKEYYSLILILILVVVIIVNLIVVLIKNIKKPKETNNKKLITNQDSYVLVKRAIQDYYIYLLDSKGNKLLESENTSSILVCKQILSKIKNSISDNNYNIFEDIDGKYRLIYMFNNQIIAISDFKESMEELIAFKDYILKINDLASFSSELVEEKTLVEFYSNLEINKKISKSNWKIESNNDFYQIYLYDFNKNIILKSFKIDNKKEAKRLVDYFIKQINKQSFVISINSDGSCYYVLRGITKETLSIGPVLKTVDECKTMIENIIINS